MIACTTASMSGSVLGRSRPSGRGGTAHCTPGRHSLLSQSSHSFRPMPRIGNAEALLDLEQVLQLRRRHRVGRLAELRRHQHGAAVGLEDLHLEVRVLDACCGSTRRRRGWPSGSCCACRRDRRRACPSPACRACDTARSRPTRRLRTPGSCTSAASCRPPRIRCCTADDNGTSRPRLRLALHDLQVHQDLARALLRRRRAGCPRSPPGTCPRAS